MQILFRTAGKVLVVEISGDLMAGQDSEKFRKIVDDTIKNEQVNVVVDMAKVTWMNSSGLGLLISALTSLRSSGGDLRLANLSEKIKRPIQITKLDTIFQDFDSVEDAVNSY